MRYNVVKVELYEQDLPEDIAKLVQSSLIQGLTDGRPDPDYPTTFRIEPVNEPADFLPDADEDERVENDPRNIDIEGHIGWCKECGYMIRKEDAMTGHPSIFECNNCSHPHTIDEITPKG